ncbi:MAG: DUF4270 domain-containing protein [Candidatus Limimorpha sp.]
MRTTIITLFSILCLALVSSCKRNPERVGDNMQPDGSVIYASFDGNYNDIIAATNKVDKITASSPASVMLGNMSDPFFGITNVGFYTQVSLSTNSHSWGNGAVADSVVLQLCYNGYYGDTTQAMTLRVYELKEKLSTDSVYYSNQEFECGVEELGNLTFIPRPLTSSDSSRSVLRIPLNTTFGNYLIDSASNFVSQSAFKDFFRGVHVVCDKQPSAGSILNFDLKNTYTFLRVYYHNDDNDDLYYNFGMTSSDASVNHFSHDYEAAAHPIVFNDTTQQYLYLQGAAGPRVWIKFPNIAQWADNIASEEGARIIINEAKLVMRGAPVMIDGQQNDTATYTPPVKLIAVGAKFDTDTTYVMLSDQLVSAEYYGGNYDKENDEVWFRLSEYVQQLINDGVGADNDGIFVYVNAGTTIPRRWIFNRIANDSLNNNLRLEIIYSKVYH